MTRIKRLVSIILLIGIVVTSNGSTFLSCDNVVLSQNKSPLEGKGMYNLLILAPREFENEIQPLVVHKNTLGIQTILVTTEQVYDAMFRYGRDDAEKIKYFIKTAQEEWNITYVLLMGGRKDQGTTESWWVPIRYSHLERPYGHYPEAKFLTDLYFADIYDQNGNFSSWDQNNNGVFSEWKEESIAEDIPDLYPDVYVGRIPCRNKLDVHIAVEKILTYETGSFSDIWFKNMVVVAGDTYTKTDYLDGEVYTQMALDYMSDFSPIKLWTSDGSLQSSWDTVRAINQGCGFIFFSGHGNPATWGTHPPYNESVWIDGMKLRYMPFLFNEEYLPVCVTGSGCFNSMFNVSLLHHPFSYYPILKCWSEAMILNPHGGSIATIGSTAFSYESSDINSNHGGIEWLDIHFFEQYGTKKREMLGEAWGNTITSFLDTFPIDWSDTSADGDAIIVKNAQQWLLMGDPSLKIGGYQ